MEIKNGRAFTIIELLVVIAIIAVLISCAFPVFRTVQNQAKKVQAKNDLTQIVVAVNAFYSEYGRYPVAVDDTPMADTSDLLYTLRSMGKGANLNDAANPRKIVFLNIPDAKDQTAPRSGIRVSDGQWCDPWGQAYRMAIDGTYDNQIANPYGTGGGAGSDPIRAGIIAWSVGKDTKLGLNGNNRFTGSDDVISWQ
jgi:prepilin-type N-terminal cleavage/methylation domain-containing protein